MDTRKSGPRRLIFGAVLGTLVTAVVSAGPAHAADGPLGPPPGDTGPVRTSEPAPPLSAEETALLRRQDAMLPAAQSLAEQSRADGTDIAGVEIDVPGSIVHVYRTDPGQPLRLPQPPPEGVRVEVHQASVDRPTMTRVATRITQDAQGLADDGVLVQSTGPAVDGSGVTVAVAVRQPGADSAELEHASQVLHRRYGTAIGEVRGVVRPETYQGDFFQGIRFNDLPGWWGGDRISRVEGDTRISCTTGFPAVTSDNKPVMLTAAHCGDVGAAFSNGPGSFGNFKPLGTVVLSDVDRDVAAISVTSTENKINVGSAEAPTQLPITGGWATPVVGQRLCQSGSFTGEVCGLRVVDTGVINCDLWFIGCLDWRGPLADVINTAGSGAFAAGHGDSGGPVYLRNSTGTGVTAMGLVSSVLTDTAAAKFPAFLPDTLLCPAPGGPPKKRCSSGFAFAHMPGH
ncbi:trypsin-like serine protease [Actinocrispum sp. NPDC049592]|uniref:trypsin-like serine protease n=1 Tax=Actinocrispum sp. NPDC049592 TaxID=3154835 RepID=UPI00341AA002